MTTKETTPRSVFAVYECIGNTANFPRFADMKVFNSLEEAKNHIASLAPYEKCSPIVQDMTEENNWTHVFDSGSTDPSKFPEGIDGKVRSSKEQWVSEDEMRQFLKSKVLSCDQFGGFVIRQEYVETPTIYEGVISHMNDWIRNRKDLHVKVGDLDNWPVGETRTVVIFDGNFQEYGLWDNYDKFKTYKPSELFQYNKHEMKYLGNMRWKFGTLEFSQASKDIEFYDHVCNRRCWRTLRGMDKHDIIYNSSLNGKDILKYEDLDKNIPIGWRGYAMFWSDVEKCDDLLYYFY